MDNTATLLRQHAEALDAIKNISRMIDDDKMDDNIRDIVLNINSLTGKLRLHLMTEDKFLLPNFMKNNKDIEKTAKEFYKEMGTVAEEFISFAHQYNTQTKIMQNREGFRRESRKIFNQIINRINKEEKELYPLFNRV